MLKHLLVTTAVGTMLAVGPAIAQTVATTPAAQESDALGKAPMQRTAVPATGLGFLETRPDNELLLEDLLGAKVVNTAGESLGDINNILIVRGGMGDAPGMGDRTGVPSAGPSATAPVRPGTATGADMAMKAPAAGESKTDGDVEKVDQSAQKQQAKVADEGDATADVAKAPKSDDVSKDAAEDVTETADMAGAMKTGDTAERASQARAEATVDRDHMARGAAHAMDGGYRVSAVIIGVGGFLGLGEKDVAVPIDRLEFQTMPNDDRVIVLNATKEQLEAAPTWKSAEERAEERSDVRDEAVARKRVNDVPAAPVAPAASN